MQKVAGSSPAILSDDKGLTFRVAWCLGTPIGAAWGVNFYLNVIKMGYFMEEARFERANYIEI